MLLRLREHFGAAGLVVAIVALVAALGGGAYAASGGSSGGKATASAAKGKPGKTGKTGKTGPAGPQGPAGPAGAKGDTGAAGSNGTNGTNGVAGPTGPTGKAGKDGEEGPEGSPWTLGGTLPSGATETGSFSVFGEAVVPISFPIPLAAPLPKDNVHIAPDAKCPGTAEDPKAAAGHLCVYQATSEGGILKIFPSGSSSSFESVGPGASTAGAVLLLGGEPIWGTWAVTAP